MVRHRSKAKLLLCVNACHRMGCLVRARRERGVDLWKTGGVVQCCSGNCNALVQDGVQCCSGNLQCIGGTMLWRKTVCIIWASSAEVNNGRPQDGAMQGNNGGQYGDGR